MMFPHYVPQIIVSSRIEPYPAVKMILSKSDPREDRVIARLERCPGQIDLWDTVIHK
jgi:hypothetical protein